MKGLSDALPQGGRDPQVEKHCSSATLEPSTKAVMSGACLKTRWAELGCCLMVEHLCSMSSPGSQGVGSNGGVMVGSQCGLNHKWASLDLFPSS